MATEAMSDYRPSRRDRIGVMILNGVARVVVSRSYRATLLNVVVAGLLAGKSLAEQRDEIMRLREGSRQRHYSRGGYSAGDIWPYTLDNLPQPSPGPAPGATFRSPRATVRPPAPPVSAIVEASLLEHLTTCDSGYCGEFNKLIHAYDALAAQWSPP